MGRSSGRTTTQSDTPPATHPPTTGMRTLLARGWEFLVALFSDPRRFMLLSCLLVLIDAVATTAIVLRVPYTEIDWIAYMEEVEGWAVDGHTNYTLLKGNTGPLVYPAGFLYVYRALRWITGGGRGAASVRIAQWCFVAVYLAVQALALAILRKSRLGPQWIGVLFLCSKRIHSLFVLRLFNDCVSMVFAYGGVLAAMNRSWLVASALFSLGVGVKMNVLLFVPGLLFLASRHLNWSGVLFQLLIPIVGLQALLGAPFLMTFPSQYAAKAFELGRVFFYKWTVNWKFLPEDVFTSKALASLLLCGHLGGLLWFAQYKWAAGDGGVWAMLRRRGWLVWCDAALDTARRRIGRRATTATSTARRKPAPTGSGSSGAGEGGDSPAYIAGVLLVSNFIGVLFARTLHYQFYTWYFHALPLLLWGLTDLPTPLRLLVLAGIEYAFNVGDAGGAATPLSSAVLQLCHAALFVGLVAFPSARWTGLARAADSAGDATIMASVAPSAARAAAAAALSLPVAAGGGGREDTHDYTGVAVTAVAATGGDGDSAHGRVPTAVRVRRQRSGMSSGLSRSRPRSKSSSSSKHRTVPTPRR